ncbi:MAG TPA: transposase, partial [Kineosporiaceae bacterium]|nr:transposase [Kineosporiaceae bacterium]
ACGDRSDPSRIGRVEVRVIAAQITITTSDTRRSETYRLVTSVLDPAVPALEIVALYHERWEIETGFAELKSTNLGGGVLRFAHPGRGRTGDLRPVDHPPGVADRDQRRHRGTARCRA